MDYAGIATAVLQNDHIYGDLAEDFAAAAATIRAASSAWLRSRNPGPGKTAKSTG